jgi:hypothetical protein
MRFETPTATRLFAWQNILAAGVFAALAAGECVSFFLNVFPSSETLWRVAIPLRRLSSPFSEYLGSVTSFHAVVPFLLLSISIALPLWAFSRRNLITTAALGHASLAVCVLMLSWALQRDLRAPAVADLSFVFDPAIMTASNVTLALTAAAMLLLCGLNHIFYIRQLTTLDR